QESGKRDDDRCVLRGDESASRHGNRQEELECSRPDLVGENTRSDDRCNEHEKEARDRNERLEHRLLTAGDLAPCEHTERRVERGPQHIGQGRRPRDFELLAKQRQAHGQASSDSPTSRRKRSSRSVADCGLSSATTFPLTITTTRSHNSAASCRMCVDNSTAALSRSVRMTRRVSTIWRGSRPIVGSSSTNAC